MRVLMCALLVLAIVAAGCGDDDDETTTQTTASDASDEETTTAVADFELSLDGDQCALVAGPSSIPAGKYTFVLTDTSGLTGGVYLFVQGHASGFTHQDTEEFHEAAGGDGSAHGVPDWVHGVKTDLGAPNLDLQDNQTQYDHILEPSAHGIVIATPSEATWLCAGFEVT